MGERRTLSVPRHFSNGEGRDQVCEKSRAFDHASGHGTALMHGFLARLTLAATIERHSAHGHARWRNDVGKSSRKRQRGYRRCNQNGQEFAQYGHGVDDRSTLRGSSPSSNRIVKPEAGFTPRRHAEAQSQPGTL